MHTGPYTAVRLDERSPGIQSRKSERVEVSTGKGDVQRLGLTDAPGTVGAGGRNRRQLLVKPPSHQSPPTATENFPLLPDDAAEPPTYPRIQVPEFRRGLAEAEVAAPPSQVRRELFHHLLETDEKYDYRSPAQVRRDLVGLDAAA